MIGFAYASTYTGSRNRIAPCHDGRTLVSARRATRQRLAQDVRMVSEGNGSERALGFYQDENIGVVRMTGADRVKFVHNMSTNNLVLLKEGQTRLTTLTNNKGRTYDLITVFIDKDQLIMLMSADAVDGILENFDKYIFPMDRVTMMNITAQVDVTHVIDPTQALGDNLPVPEPGTFFHLSFAEAEDKKPTDDILLRGLIDLTTPGFTILTFKETTEALLKHLSEAGCQRRIGKDDWELYRVQDGRPVAGRELTEDFNPLEAGLWKTVSFKKGCYIGQETIARLRTYDGVKQNLFRVDFQRHVEPGVTLRSKGTEERAGVVTSCVETTDGRGLALAYVRRKVGGAGLEVTANGVDGVVCDIPFATRSFEESADAGFF